MRAGFLFVIVALSSACVLAQEPELPGRYRLETWTAQGGQETQGLLQSVDLSRFQAVILVPKTVKMELLTPESKERAKQLASEPICPTCPKCPEQIPADMITRAADNPSPSQYFTAPKNPSPTIQDWVKLDTEQRRITAGHWIMIAISTGELAPAFWGADFSTEHLNKNVNVLVATIDVACEYIRQKEPEVWKQNELVSNSVVGLMTQLKWIESDPTGEVIKLPTGEVFSQIQFVGSAGNWEILGRFIDNAPKQNFESYNVNFFDGNKIVFVHSLIFTNIVAGQEKTFSESLYKFNFDPSKLRISITKN